MLIIIRLLHRLYKTAHSHLAVEVAGKDRQSSDPKSRETYLDDRPVSTLLDASDPEGEPAKPAEEDRRTMLDVGSIPEALRATRNCTLCLEERTDSCSTECGHLFCWSCIVGWGREKVRRSSVASERI